MDRRTLIGATGVWCGFAVAAIVNGVARERALRPAVGRAAEPLSACTLIAVILAGTDAFVRRVVPHRSDGALLAIGGLWVAGTIAFEFLFGHYVAHEPWKKLLSNYDVRQGRLWPLVLLTLLVAPVLLGRRVGQRWQCIRG
jgi:hypothetical protein